MIDALEEDVRENGPPSSEVARPALLGFDPVSAGLHNIANQLISMRMEQGNTKVRHLPGPLFPMEIVEDRLRKFSAFKRTDAIAKAQSKPKWREGANA